MKQKIFIILVISIFILDINAQNVNINSCNYTQSLLTPSIDCNSSDPWQLVFSDDFNGTALDLGNWDPLIGLPRPNEGEYCKAENAIVSNGTLKIITKKETPFVAYVPFNNTYKTFSYSSAEVWTKNYFSYGKYEARIKIPKGLGLWPAFWMYGHNFDKGEIDVFEFLDQSIPNTISMTTHFNGNQCGKSYSGPDYSSDYFIYTVIYERDRIEWYINYQLIKSQYLYTDATTTIPFTCSTSPNKPVITLKNKSFPSDPSFSIIFNTAVQEGASAPNANTIFPAQMEIDWVKFYEHKACLGNFVIVAPSQIYYNTNAYYKDTYNSFIATNISVNPTILNTTIEIAAGKQYDMIAKSSIKFEPGFVVNSTATFTARIDPLICTGSYRVADNLNNYPSDYTTEPLISTNKLDLDKIVIYPNPTTGAFNLSLTLSEEQATSFKIINSLGENVYNATLGNLTSFNKSIDAKLDNGIYFIQVMYGNKKFQEKIIVSK